MGASSSAAILKVRLTPRGGLTAITRLESGTLHVRTAAPPVGGAANRALLELLSKSLGIPKSGITIIRGETSRDKTLQIDILSAEELSDRIKTALGAGH